MKSLKLLLLLITLSTLNAKQLRFTQDLSSLLGKLSKTGFSTVLNKVNLIVGMWENIATTFSTKITNVMEKYLPGIGFDKFKSSCEFRMSIGLKLSNINYGQNQYYKIQKFHQNLQNYSQNILVMQNIQMIMYMEILICYLIKIIQKMIKLILFI